MNCITHECNSNRSRSRLGYNQIKGVSPEVSGVSAVPPLAPTPDRIEQLFQELGAKIGEYRPARRPRLGREGFPTWSPSKPDCYTADLALRHLDPEAFEEIVAAIESKRHSNEGFLNEIRTTVENELRPSGALQRVRASAGLQNPDRLWAGLGGMLEESRATVSN